MLNSTGIDREYNITKDMGASKKYSLHGYQKQIKKLVVELGFGEETTPEVFMLFMEEVGEFAKAARKSSGIKSDAGSKKHDLEEEAGDVLWLLLDLCNHLDINLEKAFLKKVEKNKKRSWA